MDFLQFLNEVKVSDDVEVQSIAASYGVHFSIHDIQMLRPLLDEVSLHWWFTGIPSQFIDKVAYAIGKDKTDDLLAMYDNLRK